MCKGFINIKANSNNKLHMLVFLILSSFNPPSPPPHVPIVLMPLNMEKVLIQQLNAT